MCKQMLLYNLIPEASDPSALLLFQFSSLRLEMLCFAIAYIEMSCQAVQVRRVMQDSQACANLPAGVKGEDDSFLLLGELYYFCYY